METVFWFLPSVKKIKSKVRKMAKQNAKQTENQIFRKANFALHAALHKTHILTFF
jgi:hypothetical protein